MSLRSDVEAVRDGTLAALAAAHDHFVYTKKVWRIVEIEIRRRGRKIVLGNEVTGSRLTERDLLRVAQSSVNDYLPVATIQQFVSLTEAFFADLVRRWLSAFPMQLNGIVALNCPTAADVDRFAEFKATRDVFVHNREEVTEMYLDKAGPLARGALGAPLDLPDSYLHEGWKLCRRIITEVGNAAAVKA